MKKIMFHILKTKFTENNQYRYIYTVISYKGYEFVKNVGIYFCIDNNC